MFLQREKNITKNKKTDLGVKFVFFFFFSWFSENLPKENTHEMKEKIALKEKTQTANFKSCGMLVKEETKKK